jgi:hypothetical protein
MTGPVGAVDGAVELLGPPGLTGVGALDGKGKEPPLPALASRVADAGAMARALLACDGPAYGWPPRDPFTSAEPGCGATTDTGASEAATGMIDGISLLA